MSLKRLFQNSLSTIHQQIEKTGLLIPLKQELHIQANGSAASEMAMVSKFGQMAPDMKVNGKITGLMVMENLSMLMVISMKVTG